MAEVGIQIPRTRFKEGSAFTATAHFRSNGAASTPTNVYYRIDNLTTCKVVADWTSVSPASSVSIPVTASQNKIDDECNPREILQLTVDSDHDLSTQVREIAVWEVENVRGL
jgi:L-rhamnose isomerase